MDKETYAICNDLGFTALQDTAVTIKLNTSRWSQNSLKKKKTRPQANLGFFKCSPSWVECAELCECNLKSAPVVAASKSSYI